MIAFKPEECIAPLNTLKEGYQIRGGHITKKEILTGLHTCGLPTNGYFWSAFRKHGIVQEISRGKYVFVGKDPIYIGKLRAIQNTYRQAYTTYQRNYVRKSSSEISPETISESIPESIPSTCLRVKPQITEEQAVQFLKEKGYKIYKYIEL